MSATATMTWPKQAVDDRLNMQPHQHYRRQPPPPPFEISSKARRILGLGVDGFPLDVPALRLTTATPELWPRQEKASGDVSERQTQSQSRFAQFEIHLAERPTQPRYVERSWQGKKISGESAKSHTQSSFEFPARQGRRRASSDTRPRYYSQPRVAEDLRQGRVSLDSVSRPPLSERSRREQTSLDLPRLKPSLKIEQRSLRPVSLAVNSRQGRASLDLPRQKTSPKTEQRPPRSVPISAYLPQGRASLDLQRPRISPTTEQRPLRPVSLAAYKSGAGAGAGVGVGGVTNTQVAASRRGKSNSFPNFSRPLSQVEPRKVPGEDGMGRMSLEKSGVRKGEILRPKMIAIEDGESQRDIPLPPEIGVVGDEKIEQDTSRSRQTEVEGMNIQQHTPPPQTSIVEVNIPQTPSTPHATSPFNNTSMNVFPEEEGSRKPKPKPRLAKLFTALPLCLLRTGNRRLAETNARLRGGGAYSKHLLTEENLRQLEKDVGSVPKMYAPDLSLPPTPHLRAPEEIIGRLTLPPSRPVHGPASPPVSQHSSKASSAANSALATKTLPILPAKIPPHTPLDEQEITKPELPERMRLSRQRQTCQVCKESRHIAHFSTWAPTTRCVHPSQTCVSCMQKWIATCMETKGWNTCICPECGEPLAYDDVKLFATQEVFARYDHLSTRAALSSLPNFHWCQSPTCSSGHIYDESTLNNPIFTCASCGHAHCLNHPSVPYHAGETCSQYDARITPPTPAASSSQKVLEEKANVKCVQETSKRCPNAICGWFIEKNEGCDMMTCWKCRFEFCWECSAPFGPISRKGNKFHKEGCKYWG